MTDLLAQAFNNSRIIIFQTCLKLCTYYYCNKKERKNNVGLCGFLRWIHILVAILVLISCSESEMKCPRKIRVRTREGSNISSRDATARVPVSSLNQTTCIIPQAFLRACKARGSPSLKPQTKLSHIRIKALSLNRKCDFRSRWQIFPNRSP